jgi:hypothetical protein
MKSKTFPLYFSVFGSQSSPQMEGVGSKCWWLEQEEGVYVEDIL